MLEPSFAVEDSRPRPPGARAAPAASLAGDHVTARAPARNYRDLIKVGIALVLLAGFGGVVASQWSNLVDLYRSVRAPAVDDDDLVRPVLSQEPQRLADAAFLVQGRYDNRDGHGLLPGG